MDFYIIVNNEQQGPYSVEQLNARGLDPSTPVWTQGMADWTEAGQVEALRTACGAWKQGGGQAQAAGDYNYMPHDPSQPPRWTGKPAAAPQGAEQPQQPPVAEPAMPAQPAAAPAASNAKVNWKWVAGIVAAVLLLLAITCPGRNSHVQRVVEETQVCVNRQADEDGSRANDFFSKFFKSSRDLIMGTSLDDYVNTYLDTSNYLFFSTGRIVTQGDSTKRVSLGVLGHVFVFGEKDVATAFEQYTEARGLVQEQAESDAANDAWEQAQKEAKKHIDAMAKQAMGQIDSTATQEVDSLGNAIGEKVEKKVSSGFKQWVNGIIQDIENAISGK